jgi:hypothetical protein
VPGQHTLTDGADAAPAPAGRSATPPTGLIVEREAVKSGRDTVKRSLVVTALVLPLAWPALGSADGPRTRAADFIGLWAGVDLDDGSFAQRAITCDRDWTCQVLGSDQFFSFCPDSEGRGLLEGVGEIEEGALDLPEFTLTCADGTRVGFRTIFSLDRRNGTLIEDTDGPPATFTFHRLSPRVDSRR